jgi:hypothetical protein
LFKSDFKYRAPMGIQRPLADPTPVMVVIDADDLKQTFS